MAIYDKPVRLLMRDMVTALGIQPKQIFDRRKVQVWFAEHYPKIKGGTINAHLSLLSTNAPSRIHHSPKLTGADDLFYQLDASHFRLYDAQNDTTPIYRPIVGPDDETENAGIESGDSDTPAEWGSEFAYERDLRNFLAKNLSLIEAGLRLYEDEGIKGIEFPVGGRFVDILAVDKNNNYVVIELKVSKGYDRVVGQLLRYMAWIEKHQAEVGQNVRGVIVAKEISEDLVLACSHVTGVHLYEYEISVTLRQV